MKRPQTNSLRYNKPALVMKTLHKVSTFLILALGIIFLSFFNLILMGDAGNQRVVRMLTHTANLVGLLFAATMLNIESLSARPGALSWFVLALFVFETVAAVRYPFRSSV
jgi:hypothetical protein